MYKGWIKEATGSSPIITKPVAIKMMNELSDAYLNHEDITEFIHVEGLSGLESSLHVRPMTTP